MPRRLVFGLLVAQLMFGGCASLRDAVIRGRLMDHRFHRDILPTLLDSYRMKMGNGVQPPRLVEPAPVGMDRG